MNRHKKEDIQVLRTYFRDERDWEDLTAHQQDKARQMRACYAYLLEAWNQADIVNFLRAEFKISPTTAYRVIRDTELIFGSLRRSNKEILRQMAIAAAKRNLRKAQEVEDIKMTDKAINTLASIGGLHDEDPDMPDFEKLQPSLIVTVLPEGMERQLLQLLEGGAIDFNKFLPPPITEDTDYEDVTGTTD